MLLGEGLEVPEQGRLAVEAAIDGVGTEFRIVHLVRFDLDEVRTDLFSQSPGQVEFLAGQDRPVGDDCQNVVASKGIHRNLQQERRIHSAAEGDQGSSQFLQLLLQQCQFSVERLRVSHQIFLQNTDACLPVETTILGPLGRSHNRGNIPSDPYLQLRLRPKVQTFRPPPPTP